MRGRAIWERINGPLPSDYRVHHKDGNSSNNDISNLAVRKIGSGGIDGFGYRVICIKGKRIREHQLVWEKHYGKAPTGSIIHHLDGNKLNNDIINLQLLTRVDHPKIEAGSFQKEGVWYKTCRDCGQTYPRDEGFWNRKSGYLAAASCKSCAKKRRKEKYPLIKDVINARRRKNKIQIL